MKKSAGVTVAGILAIVGSVGFLAFGSFAILAGIMLQANPDLIPRQQGIPTATFPIPAVLFMESVVLFALGIFGITAAIGLLRLRNWARISFAIFGGVLCPLSVLSVLGTLMAMFVLPRIVPPDPNIPPGLLTVLFGFYLVFELLVGALAAWWVVYFTRRKVKEQFMTPAEAGLPRRGPLSITIIAWLLAVSGGLSILYLPFSIPIVLFGIVFHGWMARILLLAFAGVGVLAGAGMLRWRPQAHSLAVGFYVFALINLLSYFVIPGAIARMSEGMMELMPQFQTPPVLPNDMLYRFGLLVGLLGTGVALWFLVTRRKAFLEACKTPVEAIRVSNAPLSS
jgi:hypothetical protein